MPPPGPLVFIGAWNRHKPPGGVGFAVCRFDPHTGALEPLATACPTISVGAARPDRDRGLLYCVDEHTILPGYYQGGGGQVFALAVDPESGALTEASRGPSFGALPSGLALDATGRFLVVCHHTDRVPVTKVARREDGGFEIELEYDDATTVLFPLDETGAIGAPCDVFKHSGDGGPLARQTHPQLHSVTAAPSGELFLVCDKGNDELLMFRIEAEARRLKLCAPATKTPPGSSPRYCAFHPSRPWVFVNHETRAIVSAYRYDGQGRLELVCMTDALPDGMADNFDMKQSDIAVHPRGRWLYTLIRGVSAATVFSIDEETGELQRVQTATLDGVGPRGCAISPDGRFLVIACWESHEATLWAIGDDGTLAPTGRKLAQPNAGTVTFF